jgi:MFS family permease
MATTPLTSHLRAGPSRRHQALAGALRALIAWPLMAVVLMLVGVIGLWGRADVDGVGVFFLMLLMAPLGYGLYAWPVVVAVAAMVAAWGPARRARRRGWIVAAVSAAVFPVVVGGLLAIRT